MAHPNSNRLINKPITIEPPANSQDRRLLDGWREDSQLSSQNLKLPDKATHIRSLICSN
ncbi:MAG: hypothetical protein RLZZ135_2005 [Cyanobacteriota bacterium]|jgi:hypothetical protein